MQFGKRSQPQCHTWQGSLYFMSLWMSCALLAGCGQQQQENIVRLLRDCTAKSRKQAVTQPVAENCIPPVSTDSTEWGFASDTHLTRLPIVCSGQTPFVGSPDHIEKAVAPKQFLGALLTPIASPELSNLEESVSDIPPLVEAKSPIKFDVKRVENTSAAQTMAIVAPVREELSPEERHLLDVIARDTLAVSTGAQTDFRMDQLAREKIGAAFALAQRGASYAARQELIEVLRLVSQSKDKREGTRIRSESLAAGLRALEEAEDFVPRGTQLEAEMVLEVICASHRTPLAKVADFARILPSQMLDRYNRYAQIKLALAVAGEPAGSMTLYTLGKLNSQLGQMEPEQHRMAKRRAVAFQQAALLAHNQNYMAAHELGVLLAETGHLDEARQLLHQVALREPNAVVFRNLARVHDELGHVAVASHCRMHAEQLALNGRGPAAQVAWVSPQQFAQSAPINVPPHVAAHPAPQVAARPATQAVRY